jgi:CRISPR-associated protein Csd1
MIVSQLAEARYPSPEPTARLAANQGFGREKIQFAAVFGSRGQLIALENLQTAFTRRSERLMTVPQMEGPPDSQPVNFLWDKTGPALGIRRRKGMYGAFRIEEFAFERFKAFHRSILSDIEDIGVEAFLRFLDTWSPENFLDIPDFQDKLDAKLAFRFQYDDGFLHDRRAARMAWNRVLEKNMPMSVSA